MPIANGESKRCLGSAISFHCLNCRYKNTDVSQYGPHIKPEKPIEEVKTYQHDSGYSLDTFVSVSLALVYNHSPT